MVKETVEFLRDQKNLLSDLKFFLMDNRSPLRKMSFLSNFAIVIVALAVVWYQQHTISTLKEMVAQQDVAIAKLTSSAIVQEDVNRKQLAAAESTGDSISSVFTESLDTSNKLSLLQDSYLAKLAEAEKLKDEMLKRTTIASAEINLVTKSVDTIAGDKVRKRDDVSKVTIVTKKTVPKKQSPKNKGTSKTKVVKVVDKLQQIVDPLAGKTFNSTKDFRLYWEAELWNILERA